MEDIQKRLERLERSVRYSKVLVIAMAVCTVAFATVPKARSLGSPFPLAASEFDLLGPGGKITAKLTTNDGGPNLLFYDNNGKLVEEVGINENTPASAGMAVLDGNSIIPGTGVVRESAFNSTNWCSTIRRLRNIRQVG